MIKIPVTADFDPTQVEAQLQAFQQQLNALGKQIADANKVQFNPIAKTTVDDLKKVTAQFEALKRVSGDLNKRLNATGQKGAGFLDVDWEKLYPDPHSRARQMAKAFQYVTGSGFDIPPAQDPGRRPGRRDSPPQQSPGGVVVSTVQAGLNATNRVTGGAGGVAANAIGTGMRAGVGAGLMGLVGGIAALGVGKLIGAATENVGKAEDNFIQIDRIKRQVGDIGVSFEALNEAVQGAAGNVKITFDEAGRLAGQFARLGNVTTDQAYNIESELRTGVGMSRSFGLDPAAGVGFLGAMRGMRMTQDEQGSRRMALLVGETIAKSGAFAKADEVMDALSGYVQTQARTSHTANVSGFAGMFSGMVASGIPGMDPAGAASLLGRINASLQQGGAKGEASQFVTSFVGKEMGLTPLQTLMLREGGAFATTSGHFGPGSVYEQVTGQTLSGDGTFYQGTYNYLEKAYGGESENDKLMFAHALGNHLGIGINSAMALQAIGSTGMGDLERNLQAAGVDLKDVNYTGISALAKIVTGTGKDREGIAAELWSRSGEGALSEEERAKLDEAMRSGDEGLQREILTQLVASREQESTQGKDIRDSKTLLDNLKTIAAEQLIPLTQQMRDGILFLAGVGDGKTPQEIQEAVQSAQISARYKPLIDAEKAKRPPLMDFAGYALAGGAYTEERAQAMADWRDASERIRELEGQRDKEIEETREQIWKAPDEPIKPVDTKLPEGWSGVAPEAPAATPQGQSQAALDSAFWKMAAEEGLTEEETRLAYSIYTQESGRGRNTGTSHAGARGHMQIMPGTFRGFADPGWKISNPEHNLRTGMRYVKHLNEKSGGRLRTTAGAYYGGEKAIRSDGSLKTFRDKKNPNFPTTQEYADEVMNRMNRMDAEGTPAPEAAKNDDQASAHRFIFDAPPIDITIRNERGETIAPSQQINPRISSNFYGNLA